MVKDRECRKIQIWDIDLQIWVNVHMENIVTNDIFRLWNPDGTMVTHNGQFKFIARAPSTVNCDPYEGPLPNQTPALK